jgi:hypothetical protein
MMRVRVRVRELCAFELVASRICGAVRDGGLVCHAYLIKLIFFIFYFLFFINY